MNLQPATGSQMAIRLCRIKDNESLIGNRQSAARCQFTNSYELAIGNWQPDANSISDNLWLLGNRETAARYQFAHSCELATDNWQPDANSI